MSESIYGATEFLPNLPGFRVQKSFRASGDSKRVKMFRIINGSVFPKDLSLPYLDMGGGTYQEDQSVMALGAGGTTSLISRPQSRLDIRNVGVVLSFRAHFIQKSSNGDFESGQTTRKVNIHFFTEDGTMSIVEIPQVNSGMTQGTLCARSIVWKSNGNPVVAGDFVTDEKLEIFGQVYFITDCDESTRVFLQKSSFANPYKKQSADSFSNTSDEMSLAQMKLGAARMRASLDVAGARGGENDYTDTRFRKQNTLTRNGDADRVEDWGQYRSKKNSNKTFMEAQLGNTVNNSGRDGFIRYGKKSLKFLCVWDNTAMLYGDVVEFSMVYFLSDDTVEIFTAPNASNQSKEQFSRLLQRSKLPKKFGFQSIGNHSDHPESSFYHWSDLHVGLQMDVYARSLRIIDADKQTREFYELNEISLESRRQRVQPAAVYHEREIPPSTGFGSEEDSLRSCQGPLQPNPPRIKKLGENRVLTFLAVLESGGTDAIHRRFVVTYYLQDLTLKIEEKPIRNSGFVGGVFLSRRVVPHESGEAMNEGCLFVGSLVSVYKHKFRLIETDEVTLRWMEEKGMSCGSFSIILKKLRCNENLLDDAKNGDLASAFKSRGGGSDVTVLVSVLKDVLRSYCLFDDSHIPGCENSSCNLSEHEILTIVRAIGDRKLTINYKQFISEIISSSTSE